MIQISYAQKCEILSNSVPCGGKRRDYKRDTKNGFILYGISKGMILSSSRIEGKNQYWYLNHTSVASFLVFDSGYKECICLKSNYSDLSIDDLLGNSFLIFAFISFHLFS